MAEDAYENVPVSVRLTPAGDAYAVGVVIDGGFFAFGGFKTGGFLEDLQEARENQPEPEPAPGTVSPHADQQG